MRTPNIRPSRRQGTRLRRALPAVLASGAVAAALVAAAVLRGLPDADALVHRSAPDTTKIYDRQGRLLFEVLDPLAGRRTRVPLDDVAPSLVRAVIATEDVGFYDHPGVEPRAVARALWQGAREGRLVSGASTITQQLARLVLMEPSERSERTARRKLREMALALQLSRRYEKDEILERYLNEAYFGQLAYGVEAAARTYFGKPADRLDLAESALLAGLIQSPAAYNPYVDLDAARRRQRVVLDLMVRAGFATRREAELAAAEPPHLAGGDGPLLAPHFVTWVRNELESRHGPDAVHRGALHVVTTLDLDLQRQAEAAARRHLADLQRREPGKPDYGVSNASVVAIDPPTGQVLALVGSADYFDARIDGAVNVALAARQPGSAMKPLTYAAAFDTDRWGLRRAAADDPPGAPHLPYTAATVLSDVPTAFATREGEPYRPVNYDRKWHGPLPLRRALATSSNLVAVKVLDAIGVDALIDTAEALGIRTLADRERYGLALTLGGGEVRLVELTAAYAGLAQGGRRVTPNPILAVLDAEAFRAERSDPARWHDVTTVTPYAVVSPRAAYLVTDILADDDARLPAFGEGSVLALDRPAAAKTGTTTDFRDNWTVGYTPDLAVGVWVGNADNSPMRYVSGITGAGPIWHEVMAAGLRGRPVRTFARPDGLVRRTVCTAGGGLPTGACPRRAAEWFIEGTEPLHPDAAYRELAIDAETGLLWAPGCRGRRTERTYRILPPDALEWGRKAGMRLPPDRTCPGARVGAVEAPTAPRAAAPALVIGAPAPNATFALSGQLPQEHQRLRLSAWASGGLRLESVTLLVDETPIATIDAPPYQATWSPVAGRHTARAVGRTPTGEPLESEPVRFTVLEEVPGQAPEERTP